MAMASKQPVYDSQLSGNDLSMDARRLSQGGNGVSYVSGRSVDGLRTVQGGNTKTYQYQQEPASKCGEVPTQPSPGLGISGAASLQNSRSLPISFNVKSPDSLSLGSPSSLSSRSSMEESYESLDAEIGAYREKMPPDLKVGFIDVLILYHEDNRQQAIEFRDHLINEINLPGNEKVRALVYDEPELEALHTLKIGHLNAAVERSTYVFMFLTKEFTKDKWMEFSSEACLMEAITNPEKQWCVVPVFTERRGKSFRIPMGLNTLKGISYYNNDKFYRAGLERLIGDKVQNRKAADERLKIKQKQWIERYKRELAIQNENLRRTTIMEEHKTQQLVDNLIYETGRLLRNGAIPKSETFEPQGVTVVAPSRTSSYHDGVSHSSSCGSLNPLKSQHPSVRSHFQQMNEQRQSSENGPVYYEQQNLKRSTSTPSTCYDDMGTPSVVQIQLRTEYGTQAVDVPVSLLEVIKHLPERERHVRLNEYFRQTQEQTCQKSVSDSFNPAHLNIPSALWQKIKHLQDDEREKCIDYYFKELKTQEELFSLPVRDNSITRQELPHLSAIENSFYSSYPSHQSYCSRNADRHMQSNVGLQNPAEEQIVQGAVPNLSIFEHDGLTSERSYIPTEGRSRSEQDGLTSERSYIPTEGRSMSSDMSSIPSEGQSIGEPTSMKKPVMSSHSEKITKEPATKSEKHVHYTINVYGASNIQLGDHNVMQKTKALSDSEDHSDIDDDDDGDSSVKVKSGRSKKKRSSQDPASSGDEQQLQPCKDSDFNDDEATSSKLGYRSENHSTERRVSGEVRPPQGPASAQGASCNVDAAPSTPYTLPMGAVGVKAFTGAKAVATHLPDAVAEEAEELTSSQKTKQIKEGSIESVKTSKTSEGSCLEESVNVKNQHSWFTKSSEGNKNIVSVPPVVKPGAVQTPNTGEKQRTVERPRATVKPQAVVKPMGPGSETDNDNEDLTDPKTLVRSDNTSAKAVDNSGVTEGISQSTVVKLVSTASPQPQEFEGNQSQNNQQKTEQVTVSEGYEQTNAKAAQFKFTNYAQQQQFCTKFTPVNENVSGNIDSVDANVHYRDETEVAQEACAVNQRTSVKGAPNLKQAVRNSDASVDLEYVMMDSDSFEEDHFGPTTGSSSSSNKSSKKECVLS